MLHDTLDDIKTSELTETVVSIETEVEEESQVIIHCNFKCSKRFDSYVRIWQSTFLFDTTSDHISRLVHVENISLMPVWTKVNAGSSHKFTLIFTGLPKSCSAFNLIEKIPQSGGFEINGIQRNRTDVYQVDL